MYITDTILINSRTISLMYVYSTYMEYLLSIYEYIIFICYFSKNY